MAFEGGYHGNHDYSAVSAYPKAPANYPTGTLDTGGDLLANGADPWFVVDG